MLSLERSGNGMIILQCAETATKESIRFNQRWWFMEERLQRAEKICH